MAGAAVKGNRSEERDGTATSFGHATNGTITTPTTQLAELEITEGGMVAQSERVDPNARDGQDVGGGETRERGNRRRQGILEQGNHDDSL